MMRHMATPENLANQGKLMEGYGATYIYIHDSAGTMTMATGSFPGIKVDNEA